VKKTLLLTIALLTLALAAFPQIAAWAQQPAAPAAPATPQPAVCAPAATLLPVAGVAVTPLEELLTPAPAPQAICRFRCPTTECHRDSDCTAAPGGVCTTVCPSQGCCSYPA
jgi:hypothetical protein